jgi:hypothetical protein
MKTPPPVESRAEANGLLQSLSTAKRWFVEVTEAGFTLVAFIVLVYILLGADSGPYVVSVVANIALVSDALGPETLVAVAIAATLLYLLRRKN